MKRVQLYILSLLLFPGLTGCNDSNSSQGTDGGTFIAGPPGEKGEIGEKGPAGEKGEGRIEPAILPTGVTLQSGGFDVQLEKDVLEVRAFAANILRVRFRPDGMAATDATRVLPQPGDVAPVEPVAEIDPEVRGDADSVEITTGQFTAKWEKRTATILLRDAAGKILARSPAADLQLGQVSVEHNASDALYGIADEASIGNTGILRTGLQDLKTSDQGHAGAPLVWSTSGYGVLVDTIGSETSNVDLSDSRRIVFGSISKPDVDYYLLVGRPAEIFGSVARISGRSPLFPKWAMGFTNSQWGADNAWNGDDNSVGLNETKLRDIISRYRSENIPIDAFTFDLDWMNWARAGIPNSQFTWNSEKFPNGANGGLKRWLDEQGVKMTAILKPRIPVASQEGSEATKKGWWMLNTKAVADYFLPTTDMRHVDFSKPEVIKWYTDHLGSLFDSGIAGWWNDEFGSSGATDDGNETEGLDAQRGIYNWQRTNRPGTRVWSINRNFYLGSQRYAYGLWSGDIRNGFSSMAEQRNRMLGAVNAGAMQWTMDTGGFQNGSGTFAGGGTGYEDYARWMQFAIFTPIFRVHGENGVQRQPWWYGTGYDAAVEAIRLRYRLIPYIYSYEHQRNRTGVGIVRPLIFDWPNDRNVRNDSQSWLFGEWLLASPVVEQGQRSKDIYLPQGTWTEWNSGKSQTGGQSIAFNTVKWESNFPLFFRPGAIVPMLREDVQYVGEKPLTELNRGVSRYEAHFIRLLR